jgi:hypothetical protein
MSPLNIPPEPKGTPELRAQCYIMGTYRECVILSADRMTQIIEARIAGTLFNAIVPFALVQNVALKYPSGEILQSFGAPRVTNPASLAFIGIYAF